MTVEIKPSKAKGVTVAPPSKSMAHRLLICGALAKGKTVINNIELSRDIRATLNVLSALGAEYTLNGSTVTICGIKNPPANITADCIESGSTLRMLLPVCLTFAKTKLTGSPYLFSRPLKEYERIFSKCGITFLQTENSIEVSGSLNAGIYEMRGDTSSQFISGMLFALSALNKKSEIRLITPLKSAPYVEMTIDALKTFGIDIKRQGDSYFIPSGELKPKTLTVEGDYSNSAFLEGFNCLGGKVKIEGLNPESLQGDKVYLEHFKKIKEGRPQIDLENCPDLGPVLMALSAVFKGAVFVNTNRLKIKESDRGLAMQKELKKFGVKVEIEDNKISVSGGIKPPTETLCSHNDHRIVMALSLLCSYLGGKIEGAEAVAKSWPTYFEAIRKLGVEINDT